MREASGVEIDPESETEEQAFDRNVDELVGEAMVGETILALQALARSKPQG